MTIRFCIRCQIIAAIVLVAGIAVAHDAGVELHRTTLHDSATVERGDTSSPILLFEPASSRLHSFGRGETLPYAPDVMIGEI
ncbi:MAG: hypothetical protein ACXIVE_07010 [Salinarimonas sp.]